MTPGNHPQYLGIKCVAPSRYEVLTWQQQKRQRRDPLLIHFIVLWESRKYVS